MTFRITALPPEPFAPLFPLDEAALLQSGARRVVADRQPGYPCRVSLADAAPGETMLLLHYEHQPADTPFRASHAIYVRQDAPMARPAPGVVPPMLHTRLLSIRAFEEDGMMRTADVAPGADAAAAIEAMLADPAIAYLHLHTARQGCYLARADRA